MRPGLSSLGHESSGFSRWLSGKASLCQRRRLGFDPWAGKIPWERERQPVIACLPGKSHGQRSLLGFSPQGCKRVRYDLVTEQHDSLWKVSLVEFGLGGAYPFFVLQAQRRFMKLGSMVIAAN